jgi:arylsulfatase A-like enzyme
MHSRRARLSAALLALGGLLACGSRGPRPPNVVLVVVDTLRPDRLGCYGCERDTSPELDRRADGFFLFENAQSPAPWTAPSLISLMTSAHPDVHGVHRFPIPARLGAGLSTLAEELKRAGYATAAFTEGGYAKGSFGLDRGFDVYPENPGDAAGYTSNLSHPSRLVANVDRTLEWLREARDEPFFLFFHTYEVHGPPRASFEDLARVRPDFDAAAYEDAARAAVEGWNASGALDAAAAQTLRRYEVHLGFADLPEIRDRAALRAAAAALGVEFGAESALESPELMDWLRDLYDAEVRFVDRELARIFDALDAEGLSERTIVVLTSDHGEAFGEHGTLGHGRTLHGEALRVLLMMRIPETSIPDAGPPRRIPALVRTLDVMPTLLELTGVGPPDSGVQGVSLVPLLAGADVGLAAFGQATNGEGGSERYHSVRTGRWRLIDDSTAGTAELYDVAADPGETRDLAAEHPDVVAELRAMLAAQRRSDAELRELVGGVDATAVVPDEDLQRDLRGLGYTGTDEDP